MSRSRIGVWLAAAAGTAASLWADPDVWRLAAAAATALVLLAPGPSLARLWPGPEARTRLLVLLAVASLAQTSAADLWRFATTPGVRAWNVYHYYLGAKYFAELGYHDLYTATLAADRLGGDYWRDIDRVRDLRTYEVEPRAPAEAAYRPLEHFSPERWQAFGRDVAALQQQMPPRAWRGVFRDRGYNPSPFWTVVGGALAGRFAATHAVALKLLCALDLLLLGAAFWLVRRTCGLHAAALVLLFFALTPVNHARLIGGFLQYDWFCAIAASLCLVRRRPATAAGLLAYAAMTRIFPFVFVASAAIPAGARWIRDGRVHRKTAVFCLAFALFCGLGAGLGCLTGRGAGAWGEFADNLRFHSSAHVYGEARVGLQHAFTHDLGSLDVGESRTERRDVFARQKGLYLAAAAVILLFYGLAVARRSLPDAFLFGLVPLFVLAVSSRYYWAFLALLPLLARPGPAGAERWRRLQLGQAAVLGAFSAFALARPERYASYVALDLLLVLFFGLLLASYLLRDLRVARRKRRDEPPWHRSRALALPFFVALFLLLCFLRLPLADVPIRDVDESISALIAASWLEGGVPYRDAIDQRGPVTYLIYAVVFALTEVHDMWAIHWALLLLILLVCFLLFRFGRSLRAGVPGAALGYLSAALFAVCSYTYRRSQMLAFHTEWPMILFTTLGMMLLWRGLRRGGGRELLLAGGCYAAAFLSKQPGIFDAAAGGLFVLLWQWRRGQLMSRATLRQAALLAGGFAAVLGGTVAYFSAAGALDDFYLYFWKYNVEHYTKVVSVVDRLQALDPWAHSRHYLRANPLLLAATVYQTLAAFWSLAARRRVDARLLLVLWLLAGYLGASYSGRNFGHYFIQIIPPACLLTAWLLHDAWRALSPERPAWAALGDLARAGRILLLAGTLLSVALALGRFWDDVAWNNLHREARVDRARGELLRYLSSNTSPDETLFVWGYYPEIYVLSGRRPATRYSNANYLTGMLPWENHQPGIDTSDHIVPGAWDLLMTELEASRPRVIVDTAPGDHRFYGKYPVTKFPRLAAYLERGYHRAAAVHDDGGRLVFQVWMRDGGREAARRGERR